MGVGAGMTALGANKIRQQPPPAADCVGASGAMSMGMAAQGAHQLGQQLPPAAAAVGPPSASPPRPAHLPDRRGLRWTRLPMRGTRTLRTYCKGVSATPSGKWGPRRSTKKHASAASSGSGSSSGAAGAAATTKRRIEATQGNFKSDTCSESGLAYDRDLRARLSPEQLQREQTNFDPTGEVFLNPYELEDHEIWAIIHAHQERYFGDGFHDGEKQWPAATENRRRTPKERAAKVREEWEKIRKCKRLTKKPKKRKSAEMVRLTEKNPKKRKSAETVLDAAARTLQATDPKATLDNDNSLRVCVLTMGELFDVTISRRGDRQT